MLSSLADLNLALGLGIVIDSVCSTNRIREEWDALAARRGAAFRPIEVVCSDEGEQRGRVQRRWSITGDAAAARLRDARSRFEPWEMPRLTLDSVRPLDEELAMALAYAAG